MQITAALILCGTISAVAEAEPHAQIAVEPAALRATLVNVPAARATDITLATDTGERVQASRVTPYARTAQPITIALLYNGDELFVGNEEHEPAGASQYHGTLNAVRAALHQPAFTTAFPVGSQLVALTYDVETRVRYPRGPLARFHGAVLGIEIDYRGRLGRELATGIDTALNELDRAATPRRALIVISDGTDANPDTAKHRLAALRKRALSSGVELYAVIYKTPISEESSVLATMIPAARTIASTQSLDEAVANIAAEIGRRYEVTFPLAGLPRDGRRHELTITAGHIVLDPVSLVLPRTSGSFGWWKQLGIGAVVVLLLGLAALVRSRRTGTGGPRPAAERS